MRAAMAAVTPTIATIGTDGRADQFDFLIILDVLTEEVSSQNATAILVRLPGWHNRLISPD